MCARRFCILVALIFLATECQSRRFPVFWPVPIPTAPTKPRPDRPILPDITFDISPVPVYQKQKCKNKISLRLPLTAKAIDKIINSIKREMHIPGYQFCGPGTKLDERIARGEKGVNKLDAACLNHDIAYRSRDLNDRHEADKVLLAAAQARSNAEDAGRMERLAAYFVIEAMKLKISGNVFELVSFMNRMRKLFSSMKNTIVGRRRRIENKNLDVVSDENSNSVEKDRKYSAL